MLGSNRDRNVKRMANWVLALHLALSAVIAVFAYAILRRLLVDWPLREPVSAAAGGLIVFLGVCFSIVLRAMVVKMGRAMNRVEQLSAAIEERLKVTAHVPLRGIAVSRTRRVGASQDLKTAELQRPAQQAAATGLAAQAQETAGTAAEADAMPHAAPMTPLEGRATPLHAKAAEGAESDADEEQARPTPLAEPERADLSIDADELPEL